MSSNEFKKQQMVLLLASGKTNTEVMEALELNASTFYSWLPALRNQVRTAQAQIVESAMTKVSADFEAVIGRLVSMSYGCSKDDATTLRAILAVLERIDKFVIDSDLASRLEALEERAK